MWWRFFLVCPALQLCFRGLSSHLHSLVKSGQDRAIAPSWQHLSALLQEETAEGCLSEVCQEVEGMEQESVY